MAMMAIATMMMIWRTLSTESSKMQIYHLHIHLFGDINISYLAYISPVPRLTTIFNRQLTPVNTDIIFEYGSQ